MSTTSSTPVPATAKLQSVEAVIARFDGAPEGERRRWSDEFKAQAVTAALAPGVIVSALARRLGNSPLQLFGWRKASQWKSTVGRVEHHHLPNGGFGVSARPSPFALRLDYSRKFQGISAAISLCMCWSRILRSVAAI
jgi:transposase-like protein